MEYSKLINDKKYQLFTRLLLLTIFFSIIEFGTSMYIVSFITPYKITMGLMCVVYLWAIIANKGLFKWSLNSISNCIKPVWITAVIICAYILFDLLGLVKGGNRTFVLTKYVSILSMAIILVFSCFYLGGDRNDSDGNNKVNILLFASGFPAFLTSVYSICYLLLFGETYYSRRISMLADYNKFSSTILLGMICLICLIYRTKQSWKKKNILLMITSIPGIVTIHLSGSRRSFIVMVVVLLSVFVFGAYSIIKENNEKGVWKKSLKGYLLTIMAIVILSFTAIKSYEYITALQYEDLMKGNKDISNIIGSQGVEEILTNPEALDKRKVIWSIAIDAFKKSSLKEKLIGGSPSKSLDVYNQTDNKIKMEKLYWRTIPKDQLDPHNFVLVDLLNGGIVKALLGVSSMISMLFVFNKIRKDSLLDALILVLLSVVVFVDLAISSRFGILENKFIWLILILAIAMIQDIKKKKLNVVERINSI